MSHKKVISIVHLTRENRKRKSNASKMETLLEIAGINNKAIEELDEAISNYEKAKKERDRINGFDTRYNNLIMKVRR